MYEELSRLENPQMQLSRRNVDLPLAKEDDPLCPARVQEALKLHRTIWACSSCKHLRTDMTDRTTPSTSTIKETVVKDLVTNRKRKGLYSRCKALECTSGCGTTKGPVAAASFLSTLQHSDSKVRIKTLLLNQKEFYRAPKSNKIPSVSIPVNLNLYWQEVRVWL